jgi:SiaC family regulatory phosphoprotein
LPSKYTPFENLNFMEDIVISKTTKTPAVNFKFDDNYLEIKGISIPEDADQFYTPLLDWVTEYADKKKDQKTTIALKLIYFNTSTSDYLVGILKSLKKLQPISEQINQIANEVVPSEEENGKEISVAEEGTKIEAQEAETEEELPKPTHPLTIEWYFEEEDEDMRETGTHFESIIEIPFVYQGVREIG